MHKIYFLNETSHWKGAYFGKRKRVCRNKEGVRENCWVDMFTMHAIITLQKIKKMFGINKRYTVSGC